MPTKTDRILSYLPGTFQTSPRPPVLYSVADAFGNELLLAENSLSAVMLSHWVDFADKNAEAIDDLASIAALYGLMPRDDEGVEEFREHLKRYVRTFLDGTVTVQGILRVTAEVLGLRIRDANEQLDSWWKRYAPELITVEPRGDDAAQLLLGSFALTAAGSPARPALIQGTVSVDGVDLGNQPLLRITTDILASKDISLPAGTAALDKVVDSINTATGQSIARAAGPHLVLSSPTFGPASSLQVLEGVNDAALQLLGLPPRVYHGSEASAAQLTGTGDLSGGSDLSQQRYVRLAVDATFFAEVDCVDTSSTLTGLDHIRDAINGALGVNVASHDGHHLALKSPSKGLRSIVALQRATAQDAALRMFGQSTAQVTGHDAQPARATGSRDLSSGVDLSQASNILLRIDGSPQAVDCAGADPAHTQTIEIVTAINAAFKARVASPDGTAITVVSSTVGPAGEIVFDTPPQGDATEIIFGIKPRNFQGSAETTARLAGTPDLSQDVNVMADRFLAVAVDGAGPTEVDLQVGPADPQKVSLQELAKSINDALGQNVASDDGKHLLLVSPTSGPASSLEIVPLETEKRRPFVTRALITDEAAQAILGFVAKAAEGTPATSARIAGEPDLSLGADLRDARYLQISVDGQAPVEVDCVGVRPRATLPAEVVKKINDALKQQVAGHDGHHLILTSPSSGPASRIDLGPPRTPDALSKLLGVTPGTVRGQDETRITFPGLADLTAGADLPANAAVKLSIDAGPAQEITLCGPAPAHKSLGELANAINQAMGGIVSPTGGSRLVLNSSKRGTESQIDFLLPASPDATLTVFGIPAPRSYHGDPSQPPRVVGTKDLSGDIDLSVSRFLRISLDGAPSKDVDCASEAAKPTAAKLDKVVKAINKALGVNAASAEGTHLVLTSPTPGFSGRITLASFSSGDARQKLLGDASSSAQGTDAQPATIAGAIPVTAPVDLSNRRLLRLAINGARPLDIDVAGKLPAQTSLDELVAAINRVVPGMASVTDDDRLRLVAPQTEGPSRLSVLPLRSLELVEYLPEVKNEAPRQLACGDGWFVVNDGASPAYAEIDLLAPRGTVSPGFINLTLSRSLRLLTHLNAGETAHIQQDHRRGLCVQITSAGGATRLVPGSQIIAGPPGLQANVPFDGPWSLSGDPRALQLNNPFSPSVVILRARRELTAGEIVATVVESDLSKVSAQKVTTDGTTQRLVGRLRVIDQSNISLVDAAGKPLAQLRAGADIDFTAHKDQVVAGNGPLYAGSPPLMVAQVVSQLFDVSLAFTPAAGPVVNEPYYGVTIGVADDQASLLMQINAGSPSIQASKLVKAEEFDKASALQLPQGRSDWLYMDCDDSRYNQAHFNQDLFPNGIAHECGVFNVSHFAYAPPEHIAAVFASSAQLPQPSAEITLRWTRYQPGTFAVNLPADLPERFGGRFNQTRFGMAASSPEAYVGAVTEPPNDIHFLKDLINNRPPDLGRLVQADVVPLVPLGWTPASMPFRKPQFLTLGTESTPAYLYLAEEGLDGFIELQAHEPGTWGNQIAVTARTSGPAMYDVEISYQGARFENAREVVRGLPLPSSVSELVQPSPIGVLQAKAAGVLAKVTRDGAESPFQPGGNT
jgi:hypothetical protein